MKAQSKSFSGIAGFSPFYGAGDIRLTAPGEPERVTGVPVTERFFDLLGVRRRFGRDFTAAECRWGAPRTAILSHEIWQRRFGGRPNVISTSIMLDGTPTTIVGVLPSSFDFEGTFWPGRPADLFVPYPLLFDVAPSDPVTLAGVGAVVAVVAGVAAYLPARRASRIDSVLAFPSE